MYSTLQAVKILLNSLDHRRFLSHVHLVMRSGLLIKISKKRLDVIMKNVQHPLKEHFTPYKLLVFGLLYKEMYNSFFYRCVNGK